MISSWNRSYRGKQRPDNLVKTFLRVDRRYFSHRFLCREWRGTQQHRPSRQCRCVSSDALACSSECCRPQVCSSHHAEGVAPAHTGNTYTHINDCTNRAPNDNGCLVLFWPLTWGTCGSRGGFGHSQSAGLETGEVSLSASVPVINDTSKSKLVKYFHVKCEEMKYKTISNLLAVSVYWQCVPTCIRRRPSGVLEPWALN